MRLASLAVVTALASPAYAEEPSAGTATARAVGGTVLPLVGIGSTLALPRDAQKPMFIASMAALVIAPSAGHFYAGETMSTGFQIRIAGGAALGVGVLMIYGSKGNSRDNVSRILGGFALGAAGVIAMGAGAVYDIATVGSAARDAQARPRMFSFGGSF